MDLRQLKHKYSHGPIPQWELDRLGNNSEKIGTVRHAPGGIPSPTLDGSAKPRRGRPPKSAQAVSDGDGHTDRD